MAAPLRHVFLRQNYIKLRPCLLCRNVVRFQSKGSDNEDPSVETSNSDNVETLKKPEWQKAMEMLKRVDSDISRKSELKSGYNKLVPSKQKANIEEEGDQSFAFLLRHSKLIEMGNPDGRIVMGTIIEREGDDIYIDFGGKFHCVCPVPPHDTNSKFQPGAKVRIRLHDLELSSRFLGSNTDITLLEADATLLGYIRRSDPFDGTRNVMHDDVQ